MRSLSRWVIYLNILDVVRCVKIDTLIKFTNNLPVK